MIINDGGGHSLPNLTNPAISSDLLINKQLIGPDGNIVNGTMPIVAHPNPSIIVGANGLITASHEQETGKVTGGTTQSTHQLTVQNGATITPGTSQKTAVASGRYTTGPIYVAGDANLKASNIKSGVSIFGIMGNYVGTGIKVKSGTYAGKSSPYTSFSVPVDSGVKGLLCVEVTVPDVCYERNGVPDDYTYVAYLNGFSQSGPASVLNMNGYVATSWRYGGSTSITPLGGTGGAPYIDFQVGLSGSSVIFNYGYPDSQGYFPSTSYAPSGVSYIIIYSV